MTAAGDSLGFGDLLQGLGLQTSSTMVQFVTADPDETSLAWFDRRIPGDETEAEVVVRSVRELVRSHRGDTAPTHREHSSGGWRLLVVSVPVVKDGAPSIAGAVVLARPPRSAPWRDIDRELAGFVASIYSARGGLGGDAVGLAGHDDVTGLPTRRALLALQPADLGWRTDDVATVYLLDLDRFKSVNDVVGYDLGNEMLRVIARRIVDWAGADAYVVRFGGDMFGVVRRDLQSRDEVVGAGEVLRRLIGEPAELDGTLISRSASLGAAYGVLADTSLAELVQRADDAIQAARATSGNVLRLFDDAMRARAVARAEIELHLRSAVESGAFRLYYQPEFDLRTGALLAVEALVRWQHPTLGLLSPDEFIDIAEQTNVIGEVGEWVLREACRQRARWKLEHPDRALTMRVNMSPAQFVDDEIVALVAAVLAENGLRGADLCIEITERVVQPDAAQMAHVLGRLRATGVTTAVDDFGTGHSSLSHLKTLPVDEIKVDRSFTGGLGTDAGDTAIIEALVRLARAFDLEMIAEGVETVAQAAELVRIGCYRAQGHLLGEAVPADQLSSLLAEGRLPGGILTFAAIDRP